MHSWEATENYGTYQHKQIVPESLLKTVPKEWNYTPREMKRKESGKCRWNLYVIFIYVFNTSYKLLIRTFKSFIPLLQNWAVKFCECCSLTMNKVFPNILSWLWFFKYFALKFSYCSWGLRQYIYKQGFENNQYCSINNSSTEDIFSIWQ